ncbi:MAG: gluconokinase, GntK/IdnK-type [Opitutaceae bacterium]|nr:gluconokinase, GntK/IdnK-type [Opitutaceae bacterium]
MPYVPGLRSPYAMVGQLVYLGRMLDKIRLQSAGKLPPEYQANYGEAKPLVFDARCCRFLGVRHEHLVSLTAHGAVDEDILREVERVSGPKDADACMFWNRFITKIGWRDDRSEVLATRVRESRLEGRGIETFFDLIEADEGRDPHGSKPWLAKPIHTLVIMGVAGSGKSTLGTALARVLGWDFAEGDSFHPVENVEKLSRGVPLTDEDRLPWLQALKARLDLQASSGRRTVLACSALRQSYRDLLAPDLGFTRFIHLQAREEVLARRLQDRTDHFMPPSLLPSQLATLEPPQSALRVDSSLPVADLCAFIRDRLGL